MPPMKKWGSTLMSIQPVYGIGSKNRRTNKSPQKSEPSRQNRRPYSGCGLHCGASSDVPWWSPFRRSGSGCFVLLALILELCTAKVNSQNMDIPPDTAYKLCRIFTKLNGFLTRQTDFLMDGIAKFSGRNWKHYHRLTRADTVLTGRNAPILRQVP